ncbi:hypothetical protein BGZ95_009965 [Linnemannia exigua]|uniref:Uncharacterized protein n=1 Tax=Linnemannia exigua TaxID=604196 RepID=A0AAD4HAG0_9FUNG|nr:hypothetical protein BGZ95_009965 [Linnemannia exigua]
MRIPSAEAARASTQAVLLAYLCDRYHDLATYASETLKQRVHFLAKPDGSNLKDLFIWDTPLSTRSLLLGGDGNESAQQTTPCWTPSQIQDYIQQYWSADQFPLHPPNNCNSWETVDVYFKELDQETVQAMVPIGVQDKDGAVVTLLVVLTAELDSGDHQDEHIASSAGVQGVGGRTLGASSATKRGEKTVWKYHDMVAVKAIHWEQNGWTILLPEHHLKDQQSSSILSEIDSRANGSAKEEEEEDKEDQNGDEDDSDDDYWGQYGDAEDESAADETNDKTKHNRGPSGATSETPLDEDAEEELYWRKYSEQQEEQDEIERKKMQEQQQESLQQSSSAATVVHHLGLQESSKAPTPLPGQVDPNMLSSLLQSLVMEGVQQMYPASLSDLDLQQQLEQQQQQQQQDFSALPPPRPLPLHQQTANVPVTDAAPTLDRTSPLPSSNLSEVKLMDSMRSLVADCTRAGYTKDEVFAMMENIYKSHSE